jgi:hypothetical protein
MLQPLRWEGSTAIYGVRDIEEYGLPIEEHNFMVIEQPTYEPSYEDECSMKEKIDKAKVYKKHRYSRYNRFTTILRQMLGLTGFITRKSKDLLYTIKNAVNPIYFFMGCCDHTMAWDILKKVLKKLNLQSYYNRIPTIALKLGLVKPVAKITRKQYCEILDDFKYIEEIFDEDKHEYAREYFPNIRFLVLELFRIHNVKLPVDIPPIVTPKKRVELEGLFETLIKQGGQKRFEDLIEGTYVDTLF